MASNKFESIPVSMEAMRRKVMGTIHAVERETGIFMERYAKKVGESDQWMDYIETLQSQFGRATDSLEDFKDVDALLQRARGEDSLCRSQEYSELRRMVERGKMFEYIGFSLRNDLVDAYESHLRKYCLSFAPEAKGENLNTVRDYENRVIDWDETVRERLEIVDNYLDQIDSYKSPLRKYIGEYDQVVHLMDETCKALLNACDPMKKWAVSDSTYPRRLQEEINAYNRKKMELKDVIKQLEYQRDQQGLRLRRRAFHTLKMEKMLQDVREEKMYYKRRQRTIKENWAKAEADIDRKRQDISEVKARIKNRQDNSPTVYNYLMSLVESLRDDIRILESKIDNYQVQSARLRQQQDQSQKEIDKLQNEVNNTQAQHDMATEKLQKEERDLKLVKDEITSLENKCEALKRIREIKLHSDTVKKIYHYGYNPGQIRNASDDLDSAFKIASADVGKDWASLYKKLPFLPLRDFKERSRDLEVIDLSNRRTDGGFELLALKSLEKWRRLSTIASVEELIEALKKMKKQDTVRRIEREILRPATTNDLLAVDG